MSLPPARRPLKPARQDSARPVATSSAPPASARLRAALALQQVWAGRSLDDALQLQGLSARDQRQAQWLAYNATRWAQRLEALLDLLLDKPLKARDQDLKALLLVALYELQASRAPAPASVNEAVALAAQLDKDWARGLVNAVLRRYLRERAALDARLDGLEPAVASSHPQWLVEALQAAYPEDWPAVLAANNAHPPLVLRVNRRRLAREAYLAHLAAAGLAAQGQARTAAGVVLDAPVAVESLPGWREGWVSVQDGAAQLAAPLVNPQPGERVLDACAAPGGKTAHLLELADLDLWAVDISARRLGQIRENLQRLGLPAARLIAADAAQPDAWWDGVPFDRILLDAPCSATGVIRRHPDIKLLRRAGDIPALAARQRALLAALWPLLRPGGRFVYATCSVLPTENAEQIAAFCASHADARCLALPGTGQVLPGADGMDGFFYAVLEKEAA